MSFKSIVNIIVSLIIFGVFIDYFSILSYFGVGTIIFVFTRLFIPKHAPNSDMTYIILFWPGFITNIMV